jgi:hypothetical protein
MIVDDVKNYRDIVMVTDIDRTLLGQSGVKSLTLSNQSSPHNGRYRHAVILCSHAGFSAHDGRRDSAWVMLKGGFVEQPRALMGVASVSLSAGKP